MPTPKPELLPVRFVCGNCLGVRREKPLVVWHRRSRGRNGGLMLYKVEYALPQCCGVEMLIAGEPKTEATGVTGKIGTVVDPVDNLRRNT